MMDDEEGLSGSPVIKRMLKNYKLANDAESENRKRGLEALKFRRGGKDQWDGSVYEAFGNQNKPRESFNQIPQFIHQVTNDMRMNMPQTRIMAGDEGDDKVAEIREDLCRDIQSTSEGEVAYDTAVESQVTIGWGYWRYITRYADKKSKNQVIDVRWIPNTFKVYDDPNAMLQDFSDRKFLIEIEDVNVDDFNNDYKKKYDSDLLGSIGDTAPDWATKDTVRIAEYWEVTHDKKTLYFDADGNLTEEETEDSRDVDEPKVTWHKCTANEVLEEREWEGIYIPYVRVSGETLYIDGKVYYLGLVDGIIAAQRQYNYYANNAMWVSSLAPLSPFILDPEQIEGYQEFWDQANVKAYPFLPAKAINAATGQPYPRVERADNRMDISTSLLMVQQAQNNFYVLSGLHQASLGEPSNEKSGKAILARQKEGDVSTFHFQDNLARALRFGGRILNDLIPKIYDGARKVSLLKEDKTSYQETINQEHDGPTGKQNFDITKGEYSVSVTTGPSYSTRKAEAADQAGQLIQSFPQVMQTKAGPTLIRSLDLVNAEQIADDLEASLPPQLQTPPELKDLPPQVQNAIQQGQQQIQQLTEQLQQAQQIIQQGSQEMQGLQSQLENKQADSQAKVADSQAKTAAEQRKYQLDSANIELEHARLAHQIQLDEADIALRARALDIQAFTAGMSVMQDQQDMEQSVIDQAMGQQHDLNMQANDQVHQHELAVTQAALQPVDNKPEDVNTGTDNSAVA